MAITPPTPRTTVGNLRHRSAPAPCHVCTDLRRTRELLADCGLPGTRRPNFDR
ncbi:hypothetical protein [Streptomyces cahuitamycinicus]|uniref:hypothetical protein n=1 Tax=Streptomyces cahuitamycinicus TaxID=2070367 RepID=UPI0015E10FF0|nr:hypothetical protein [Streptomyces cahuitamycinicus]